MGTWTTAAEAATTIRSGDRVFVHSVAAAPRLLVEAMAARKDELRGVEVVHVHTEGPAPYAEPGAAAAFRHNALFVGANVRRAVHEGRADVTPVFLSDVPRLFREGLLPIDVALVTVSPPDRHGWCSLGVSVDASRAAVDTARTVVAQVNPRMPRTHGAGLVHLDDLDWLVEGDEPIHELARPAPGEVERAIARNVAELVPDGATLQIGIGAVPDAVLSALSSHQRLGVHTEMLTDGVVDLVRKGAVTGEEKRIDPGRIVAGFALGTRALYDFVDDNPLVQVLDVAYVNDTATIRRNPRVTAVNGAIEVDLGGQVCADSIGERIHSGVGGQVDFVRGAALSEGGRPIFALPSTTNAGEPRIVATLRPGAGVVTTRAHVHFVVTEHGIASLHGRNLRQRAEALVAIAHPRHREALAREARRRFGSGFAR